MDSPVSTAWMMTTIAMAMAIIAIAMGMAMAQHTCLVDLWQTKYRRTRLMQVHVRVLASGGGATLMLLLRV